jgi:hypothetical protein
MEMGENHGRSVRKEMSDVRAIICRPDMPSIDNCWMSSCMIGKEDTTSILHRHPYIVPQKLFFSRKRRRAVFPYIKKVKQG